MLFANVPGKRARHAALASPPRATGALPTYVVHREGLAAFAFCRFIGNGGFRFGTAVVRRLARTATGEREGRKKGSGDEEGAERRDVHDQAQCILRAQPSSDAVWACPRSHFLD